MTQMKSMARMALDWHRERRGVAIAHVISTWGSAPRRTGSQMIVDGSGAMEGSVSGGCVEGAVVHEAMAALEDGHARVCEYGVSDDDAFAVGLACGGTIRVLVEPVGSALPVEMLERIARAEDARDAIAYEVDLTTWERQLSPPDGPHADRFRRDQSGEEAGRFVLIANPPLRLAIVGAVHIAQALTPMARIAGFDPVIIDPRAAFGSQARFPGEVLIDDWPDAALTQLAPDARTAVVVLSHDPKIDDPALHVALASPAFYVGALGSTRTHAKRLERLENDGMGRGDLGRLSAPIGLDIGAATPAEIAVSILAEMVAALRQRA